MKKRKENSLDNFQFNPPAQKEQRKKSELPAGISKLMYEAMCQLNHEFQKNQMEFQRQNEKARRISDEPEKTQERESENLKLFRYLINHANDAIYIVDLETDKISDVNEKACHDLKYKRTELLNMSVPDIEMTFPEALAWKQHITRVRKNKCVLLEGRHKRKDGSVFPVEANITFVSYGNKEYIVGIVRDMTERKAIEAQQCYVRKLESLGILAGGIAHEFNNLLCMIYGNIEILWDNVEPEARQKLKTVLDLSERGANLVRQLLHFSRRAEVNFQTIYLNAEIRSVSQILERQMPKIIEIELELAEKLCPVSADQCQIRQILMNLALNAKDAMHEGGKLVFKTENTLYNNEKWIMLMVSDTGQGMDRDIQEHIFDPFFTTKEIGKGAGLGLSVIYGIIIKHNGLIFCDSSVGKGTVFTIYLPAAMN